MPLSAEKIRELIKETIPDASIEIKDLMGDNNHYSAVIKSKLFNKIVSECKSVYVCLDQDAKEKELKIKNQLIERSKNSKLYQW